MTKISSDYMLEHNANVDIPDNDGKTPLDWALKRGDENLARLLLEH